MKFRLLFAAFVCAFLHSALAVLPDLQLVPVSDGQVVAPIAIENAGDDSGRLFFVDQRGKIHVFEDEMVRPVPFLDIGAKLVTQRMNFDERGLLGLAFHPDYGTPSADGEGKFYVYYSAPSPNAPGTGVAPVDHQSVIAEYSVSAGDPNVADPLSERILLSFDQPQFNHNGGDLAFDANGLLYIAVGDGGGSGDDDAGHTGSGTASILGNAQDLTNLLGKILRIDPFGNNGPGGEYGIPAGNPFVGGMAGEREEIFIYGLRNPWRIAFDSGDMDRLFVGEVGQGQVEEINLIDITSDAGINLGWRNKEGSFDNDATAPGTGPFVDPIAEYAHPGVTIGMPALPQLGISITGGEVYRGSAITGLEGAYLFGDWSSSFDEPGDGRLMGLEETSADVFELTTLSISGGNPIPRFVTAFGTDEEGEIYVATRTVLLPERDGQDNATGVIYRFAEAPETQSTTLNPSKDNTMFEEDNEASGIGTKLYSGVTGGANGGNHRRALMAFDVSGIPSGSTIESVSLEMRVTNSNSQGNPFDFALHRLTADWGEAGSNSPQGGGVPALLGDATWNHRFFSTDLWTTAGGDFVGAASATTSIADTTGVDATWSSAGLVSDVQIWLDTPALNFGWVLKDTQDSGRSAKGFSSREEATAANRPELTIEYSPAGGSSALTYRAEWLQRFYGVGEFVDPASDEDGDNLTVEEEFAFDLTPTEPELSPLGFEVVAGVAKFTFVRDVRITSRDYRLLRNVGDVIDGPVVAESIAGAVTVLGGGATGSVAETDHPTNANLKMVTYTETVGSDTPVTFTLELTR